jgi:excisionase family DNA binding protein
MAGKQQGFGRLLTLLEAAKVLGVSYERMRVFVDEGRLPAIEVPGIGRVVRREDLERFQKAPRPTGRPPAHRRRPRRAHRGPGSIPELLASVEKKTGLPPTLSAYRSLIKVALLPRRRDFPRGEEGRRLCLAHQYRRLVAIMRLRKRAVTTYRDLAIGLKLYRYRVSHDTLTRAMLSYLYGHWKARETLTDDDLEQFILNESFEERPPRLPGHTQRRQRETAYRGLLRIGFGQTFTAQDMTVARDAVGLPKEILPDRDTSGEKPGLSWNDLFQGIQALDAKLGHLVRQTIIGERQRGRRHLILYKPFATPGELDNAWNVARSLLQHLMPLLLQRLRGVSPRAHVFYVNATIVKVVTSCLVQLREQGDIAFSPFQGDLASFNPLWQEACVRLMVAPPPEPMASLIRRVLSAPPKTDQERRQIVGKFEEIARSASLSDGDRRAVETMLATLKRPSKKGFKRMLATFEAWRAGANRLPNTEVRAE